MSMGAIHYYYGGHIKHINPSCANVLLPGNQFTKSFHQQLIRPSSNHSIVAATHLSCTIRSQAQAQQPSEFSSTSRFTTEISVVADDDGCSPSRQSIIIGDRWREYHGCGEWRGLLEPLDPALREEIIKYGDMAQLTYDSFNVETKRCIYGEADLLKLNPKILARGYKVTKYIYEMPEVSLIPGWLQKWRSNSKSKSEEEEEEEEEGVWVGYIAVMEDEEEIRRMGRRDVVVVWRGTQTTEEWLKDIDGSIIEPDHDKVGALVSGLHFHVTDLDGDVGIERGFWTLYASGGGNSARVQVTEEIRRLVSVYGGAGAGDGQAEEEEEELSISMTGHSLGAALALVCAYDVASLGLNSSAPISVFSFAGPRVGNAAFKRRLHDELKVNVLRVVNSGDVVPKVPGSLVSFLDDEAEVEVEVVDKKPVTLYNVLHTLLHAAHPAYVHVGIALHLDNSHSPFLKTSAKLADLHNLEVYLHLVDGYRSTDEPFVGPSPINYQLVSENSISLDSLPDTLLQLYVDFLSRNVALVNKSSDVLHDDLEIPPNWWTTFITTQKNATS